jgi:hypothetical protein
MAVYLLFRFSLLLLPARFIAHTQIFDMRLWLEKILFPCLSAWMVAESPDLLAKIGGHLIAPTQIQRESAGARVPIFGYSALRVVLSLP